jgi:hypothetical protein
LCSSIGCGGLKIWLFVTSRFEDEFIVYIWYNSRIDFYLPCRHFSSLADSNFKSEIYHQIRLSLVLW